MGHGVTKFEQSLRGGADPAESLVRPLELGEQFWLSAAVVLAASGGPSSRLELVYS